MIKKLSILVLSGIISLECAKKVRIYSPTSRNIQTQLTEIINDRPCLIRSHDTNNDGKIDLRELYIGHMIITNEDYVVVYDRFPQQYMIDLDLDGEMDGIFFDARRNGFNGDEVFTSYGRSKKEDEKPKFNDLDFNY